MISKKRKPCSTTKEDQEGLSGGRQAGGDVFSSFFGGFGFLGLNGGHRQGQHETPRGADVLLEVLVTLEGAVCRYV